MDARRGRLRRRRSLLSEARGEMAIIYVIDDQDLNREFVSRLARSVRQGAEVTSFADARAALAAAYTCAPDLVVTDLSMPGMGGVDLIDGLRRAPGCQEVPIIVVTAHEDVHLRYEALERGATDFLTSPLDRIEFRARAQNLLRLRERARRVGRDGGRGSLALEVFESAADPVMVVDNERRVRFCNAAAARVIGLDESEVVGLQIDDAVIAASVRERLGLGVRAGWRGVAFDGGSAWRLSDPVNGEAMVAVRFDASAYECQRSGCMNRLAG